MRKAPNFKAERHRVEGPGRSNNGFFRVPVPGGAVLSVQVSDGGGWDHVSVALPFRCPTWEEMALVADLFFRDDECAMQLRVPKSDHLTYHDYCLHWWRPQTPEEAAVVRREWKEAEGFAPAVDSPLATPIPRPPPWMVAPPAVPEGDRNG